MSAELMPIEEQDERIFAAWKSGKGQRTIAREMDVSQMEVEQAIDRALPALSQLTQSRAYKRQLFLMEDLNTEFYACPGNCSGMEEATGAPSSLAV